jgi:hypothetical protein
MPVLYLCETMPCWRLATMRPEAGVGHAQKTPLKGLRFESLQVLPRWTLTCAARAAAYYGLPPGWIGRLVKVQWNALHARILHPKHRTVVPRTQLRQAQSETKDWVVRIFSLDQRGLCPRDHTYVVRDQTSRVCEHGFVRGFRVRSGCSIVLRWEETGGAG